MISSDFVFKIKIHQEGQKELTVRRDEILKLEQEIADKGKQISQLKDEKEELVKNLDDVTEKLQQEKESHALVQEAIQSLEESNKESLLKVEMVRHMYYLSSLLFSTNSSNRPFSDLRRKR